MVHKAFVKIPEQKLTERANWFSCSVSLCEALRTPAVVAGFTAAAEGATGPNSRGKVWLYLVFYLNVSGMWRC